MTTQAIFAVGGRYNWKSQTERLVYMGHNWAGNGYWHQFSRVETPSVVWCEVRTSDLHMLEETPLEFTKPLENSMASDSTQSHTHKEDEALQVSDETFEKLWTLFSRHMSNFNANRDNTETRAEIDKMIAASRPVAVAGPLSKSEQEAVLKDPKGIACLLDRHDCWIVEAEARDMHECVPSHAKRLRELLALGRAIIAEDPECFTDEQKKPFKLRYSEATTKAGGAS